MTSSLSASGSNIPSSKNRLRWPALPREVQLEVQRLIGGPVVAAGNCPSGFSPGMAARVIIADGRRAFVKAINALSWPEEAIAYRAEASIGEALASLIPAPRLLGSFDDGQWVVLAFEHIDGAEPDQPWNLPELSRVVTAVSEMAKALTPSPIHLSRDHPRLGGWAELASDPGSRAMLSAHPDWATRWAAHNLDRLVELERDGLANAHGETVVHFDLYPHNLLITADRVYVIDWPHARLGHLCIDLIQLLSSVAADGINPEPFLAAARAAVEPHSVTTILAAHAGFLIAGGFSIGPPELSAIPAAKMRLGLGATRWLQHRLEVMR